MDSVPQLPPTVRYEGEYRRCCTGLVMEPGTKYAVKIRKRRRSVEFPPISIGTDRFTAEQQTFTV